MQLPSINSILKYQLIFLVGIFVLTAGIIIYIIFDLLTYTPEEPAVIVIEQEQSDLIMRRIDGVEVEQGQENFYPVAVNIDNHFDSWPNFGLSQASLVYETKVEGSATRFLAFYVPRSDEISKIGPVRSTRPYFVELAKEYQALLAHSGGSPASLARIEELEVSNLEEIAWWGPDYFWRVYSRQEPHNLFSSSKNLVQGVIDWELGEEVPDYRAWQFQPEADPPRADWADNSQEASTIHIEFSAAPIYDVSYQYSSSTQKYLRWQADEEHIDGLNNQQIEVSNIVVQFVPKEIILDNEGRIKLNLIGRGEAWILRDGIIIKGSWKKRDYNSRTVFYDENNDEIEFKPGSIWIEIVPQGRDVEVE